MCFLYHSQIKMERGQGTLTVLSKMKNMRFFFFFQIPIFKRVLTLEKGRKQITVTVLF